jgi:RimJ/RimL family protein N-acetyltransferase
VPAGQVRDNASNLPDHIPMPLFEPVTLATDRLTLRPMRLEDVPLLAAAAGDGALWEKTTTTVPRPDAMQAYVEKALALQQAGSQLPFTTFVSEGERVVGSTRYMNIDEPNRRAEIGTTFIAGSWQRSFVNTHAKFLMLRHAFETLDCLAVEFRTHVRNDQSRTAIERLGAKLDGVLRSHMIMPDGHVRDTVVYSIVKEEWPAVKARLSARMAEAPVA